MWTWGQGLNNLMPGAHMGPMGPYGLHGPTWPHMGPMGPMGPTGPMGPGPGPGPGPLLLGADLSKNTSWKKLTCSVCGKGVILCFLEQQKAKT